MDIFLNPAQTPARGQRNPNVEGLWASPLRPVAMTGLAQGF